jgi:hypothetical protein
VVAMFFAGGHWLPPPFSGPVFIEKKLQRAKSKRKKKYCRQEKNEQIEERRARKTSIRLRFNCSP